MMPKPRLTFGQVRPLSEIFSDQKCIRKYPGNHLLLSITAFGGRVAQANLVPSSVQEEHEEDDALKSSEPNASETPKESTTVQSVQKGESRV